MIELTNEVTEDTPADHDFCLSFPLQYLVGIGCEILSDKFPLNQIKKFSWRSTAWTAVQILHHYLRNPAAVLSLYAFLYRNLAHPRLS